MASNYLNDWKINEYNASNNDILVYQSKLDLEPITIQYIGSVSIFPRDPQCSMVDIFTCCCRQQFNLDKGSIGFIGGVDASIASMEIFHLYQKLNDILKYISTEDRSPMSRGIARYTSISCKYVIFFICKFSSFSNCILIFPEITSAEVDVHMIHFVTLEYAVAMKDTKRNMENVGLDLEILPE